MSSPAKKDRVQRAMTDDGAFRVMTARTTETVREVLQAQGVKGQLGRALGELVTAAVLYRETMAPTLRVQIALKGAGESGTLLADSHPDGWARGLVQRKADAPPFELGEGAMMQLMRSLPNGELHQGVVHVPERSISEAVMGYMRQSEQIETMARVATVFEGDEVIAAGGYLVQILPEAPDQEGALLVMAQRLEDDFASIDERLAKTDADAHELMEEILYAMPHTQLGDSGVRFDCDCSRARVMGSLASLGRDDIRSLVDDGEPLEMSCDWCDTQYVIELPELQGLLSPS
ncbi:MAG: heat-shock protein Hsp33 [Sandaracinus sp.]|nr:heat-shock protein Hsp33 [Sandaracinus sp.]